MVYKVCERDVSHLPWWKVRREGAVPRRKSIVGQLFSVYQQNKRERERKQRQAQAELRRWQQGLERDAAQRERAAERARQAEEKKQARAEQARQRKAEQRKKERQRQLATQARERERQQAQGKRDEQRRALDQRVAEAEAMTDAVRTRTDELEGVLRHRTKGLASRCADVEQTFNASGPKALAGAIQQALAASAYPDGLGGTCLAFYRPELREVLIQYELPPRSTVPQVVAYRYVKSKNLIQPEPRKDTDIKKLYSQLIARVTLRTLAEAFDIVPVTLVSGIVFNGYVSSKDRATGKAIRPCVISVNATRDAFDEIVLDEPELDPVLCLRSYLNAIVSPHPYDLEPVRPVLQFDLSKYKFDEEMDVVAGLDSRPDLLALKPVEFEHLVRRLFEAIGMKSWVTQASRDDGVDAVATNEDPIVGGLCIIQAKRYSKIVRHEAVQALAGVMEDKAAAKGVLVTTSWVGKASRDFASRNGRMEIIEGRHLKSLLKEHLDLDVLISLPTLPPSWNQGDIS